MSKVMCMLALVALCIGLMAGGALANTWTLGANTIPDGMTWDQNAEVTVDTTSVTGNDANLWAAWYAIVSVNGPTGSAMALVDRWVTNEVPIGTGIGMDVVKTWAFDITAPPIAAMTYASPSAEPAPAKLACKWELCDTGHHLPEYGGEVPFVLYYANPMAGKDVAVGRFSDILDAANVWDAAQVQQLAGLFPKVIVGGYPDGSYGPNLFVTRDQMAVFMQRALGLVTTSYQGLFPADVPSTNWAALQIEAMADAGLVGGYGGGVYAPAVVVTRDQMAVFVARGMEMSPIIPSGPPTATFTDVPVGFWAYNAVEYCKAAGVVGGYTPTIYAPAVFVTRAQMAIFIYRAFIKPVDSMIVLAGPGLTTGDPKATVGVSTAATDPTLAYVGFDAVRLGALVPTVDFEIKDSLGVVVASGSDTLDSGEIAAAVASGIPYVYATFPIAGLLAGTYTLEVSVGSDVMSRKPAFTISP